MAVFRRTRRLGRKLAAASGPGSAQSVSSVPGAPEDEDFQDPPRHWGRVGALVGVWALVLGGGAWFAPAFASGGSDENIDPRDEAATDANGAVIRYLRYGSRGDSERADDAICEGATPQLSPEDLLEIRDHFAETAFDDDIPDIEVEPHDPVSSENGTSIPATVAYIPGGGGQRYAEFLVTIQESDGEYCVSDAVRTDEPDDSGSTGPGVDPQTVATEYLRTIFVNPQEDKAEGYQCAGYDGLKFSEIEQGIADWEAANTAAGGELESYLTGLPSPLANASGESEVFEAEVRLDGLTSETFVFEVAVQGDCVASLTGGEGLIPSDED